MSSWKNVGSHILHALHWRPKLHHSRSREDVTPGDLHPDHAVGDHLGDSLPPPPPPTRETSSDNLTQGQAPNLLETLCHLNISRDDPSSDEVILFEVVTVILC